MPSPASAPAATITTTTTSAASAASTYTSIPISASDVIQRSIQNLSVFISRRRPWTEFLAAAGALDRPSSLSDAGVRLSRNSKYFAVNYAIVVVTCAAAALIGSPIALIFLGFVFALWLLFYFFREDPVVVWDLHLSDRAVILALALISGLTVWGTGMLNSLLIGISVGFVVSAFHGIFKNPEGLFMDESDAVSNNLVARSGIS